MIFLIPGIRTVIVYSYGRYDEHYSTIPGLFEIEHGANTIDKRT
jgi:hypothetical protein